MPRALLGGTPECASLPRADVQQTRLRRGPLDRQHASTFNADDVPQPPGDPPIGIQSDCSVRCGLWARGPPIETEPLRPAHTVQGLISGRSP